VTDFTPGMMAASARLFAAWQSAGTERRTALEGLTEPGAIALRSRYRHLLDPEAPPGPWDTGLTWEQWQEIVLLENEGDLAVRRGASAAGGRAACEHPPRGRVAGGGAAVPFRAGGGDALA